MIKMKRITGLSISFFLLLVVVSCSNNGGKNRESSLKDKKEELQKLKDKKEKLEVDIKKLEVDIAKLDTGMNKQQIAKLVSITTVTPQNFSHYLDLQGRIDAENISYITPRGVGGQVKALFVKKGDLVNK